MVLADLCGFHRFWPTWVVLVGIGWAIFDF